MNVIQLNPRSTILKDGFLGGGYGTTVIVIKLIVIMHKS